MERIVILSDIHSNKLALNAVLNDFEDADRIWFLGDLLGYGPYPVWVYQTMKMLNPEVWLKGNHDWAICGDSHCYGGMNPVARYSVDNHIEILPVKHIKEIDKLGISDSAPMGDSSIFLVHGIPWEDAHGSITYYQRDIAPSKQNKLEDPLKIRKKYTPEINIWIVGHSHVQTAWLWEQDKQSWCLFDGFGASLFGNSSRNRLPEGQTSLYQIELPFSKITKDNLLILNPGSIGFPRDTSPTSSGQLYSTYMVLERHAKHIKIDFRAVSYNGAEMLSLAERKYLPELYERFKSEIVYLK